MNILVSGLLNIETTVSVAAFLFRITPSTINFSE